LVLNRNFYIAIHNNRNQFSPVDFPQLQLPISKFQMKSSVALMSATDIGQQMFMFTCGLSYQPFRYQLDSFLLYSVAFDVTVDHETLGLSIVHFALALGSAMPGAVSVQKQR